MITDKLYAEVNNDFDEALLYMHKMPKIWLAYCHFLMKQKKITMTRRTFDRALQSLPITQHDMIWDVHPVRSRLRRVGDGGSRVPPLHADRAFGGGAIH